MKSLQITCTNNANLDRLLLSFFSFLQKFSVESSHDAYLKEEESSQDVRKILDDYGNSILRLSYSYLHNMADAEDILQDTMVQYLKKAPSFQEASHKKAWLLTVASNLSKNKIDYNNVRKTDELDERLAGEEKKDLSFVYQAIRSLPVQYGEVIHLFYYEGYSTKEISKILKRKETTIRSDLSRAREKLKQILQEEYDFGE